MMDPQHTGALLKHLEKQNELLKEAHKNMSQELQRVKVEEEMMMRKFYELMNIHRLNKKKMEESQKVWEVKETIEASSSPSKSYEEH